MQEGMLMKTLLRATALALSFLLLFALFSRPAVFAATPPEGSTNFATLDTVITAQMSKHGLPGVALAVIESGEIVYLKGYGSAGMDRAMTPQTPMFIGSQSKSFTALAIAQLADQGKLDLNAPVQTYIPWFRVADEAAARQITLNHLLHHTSGLSDAGYGVLLPLDASLEQAVRSLAQAQITAPVGSKHQYFNTGYSVLAYLIELTSGESYASYIRNHILTPLGMRSTTAAPTTASGVAQGYSRLFGFPLPMRQDIPAYAVGAGYIVSNAEDLARYAIAIQSGGARLVSPEMMKNILTPGVGAYGMGWYIVDNGAKIFHGGANETFRTEVNLYPTRNRAFVLLTNEGYQVDHFISAGQLTASVEAIVLGNPAPPLSQGWSVQWIGWGIGILVLGLIGLHTHNFLALRGWRKRIRTLSPARQVLDVAISFLIPTVILLIVYSQVKAFYGDRFNLLTNLAYLSSGLPDVFILMLVGTLPDYLQGILKIIWRFS
jgi:CubicO group peptidase (beta-lactamase class C family)